jgi:hypothetical protein
MKITKQNSEFNDNQCVYKIIKAEQMKEASRAPPKAYREKIAKCVDTRTAESRRVDGAVHVGGANCQVFYFFIIKQPQRVFF